MSEKDEVVKTIWKLVPGFYDYLVSNKGQVFSLKRMKFLKPSSDSAGYYNYGLYHKKVKTTLGIHVVLGRTFIPNPDNLSIVDHINRIKTDNRLCNLRHASYSQNGMNKAVRSDNSSSVTGVHWNNKKRRYCANIKVQGKLKYLGVYKTLEEAKEARLKGENEYFKEFSPNYHRN